MKKTIIRIVAVAMLALMVLTALPAFAYNIVGTAAAQTPVYKDTKGRKVELYVSGPVTINRQDNKSGMYNVTVSYDGKTYTGWVYPSAISGIGYDKSTGGSASGSTSGTTGGTTSGVTGTYTATIATGAAINVNGTNYPVSVGGSINVNYRDAAGTQVNVTVGNVTGWVAASSLSGFRRNGSSISLSDLPTSGGTIGGTIGGTTSPAPTPYVNQNQNQNTASGTFSANLAAGTAITNNGKTVGIVQNAGNVTVNYRDASGSQVFVTIGSVAGWVPASAISNLRSTSSGSINVANLPTSGGTAGSTGGTASGVKMYDKAKSAVSKDNNIYVRSTATSSTKGATKLRNMRGKTFTVLGTDASGSFLYADYNGTRGFVRAQDFTFTSGNVVEQKPNNNTGTNGGNVTSNNTGMAAIGTPAGKGTGSSSEKWGSITIPGASTYPIYGNYIGEKKGKTYYYYDYVLRKSYYYVHTTTAQGSQVAVVMGHNNRKKVGTSNSYFHNLHHIQNAILGKSSCEKCKASCSGYGKSISASWEGSSSWEVVAFFEVPKNKAYKNILPQMAQPWNYTTAQYLSNVKSYVNTFSSKSWMNEGALTDNGKYMMLVTCGDSGDNDSIAKLYMLLKAVG